MSEIYDHRCLRYSSDESGNGPLYVYIESSLIQICNTVNSDARSFELSEAEKWVYRPIRNPRLLRL